MTREEVEKVYGLNPMAMNFVVGEHANVLAWFITAANRVRRLTHRLFVGIGVEKTSVVADCD